MRDQQKICLECGKAKGNALNCAKTPDKECAYMSIPVLCTKKYPRTLQRRVSVLQEPNWVMKAIAQIQHKEVGK